MFDRLNGQRFFFENIFAKMWSYDKQTITLEKRDVYFQQDKPSGCNT